jgi:hypothetical protein
MDDATAEALFKNVPKTQPKPDAAALNPPPPGGDITTGPPDADLGPNAHWERDSGGWKVARGNGPTAEKIAPSSLKLPAEADELYRRVRKAEGTSAGDGFLTFGGDKFTPGPEHPGAAARRPGPSGPTSAAGPGQWEEGTWNGLKGEFAEKFGRPPVFASDEDQKAMVWLNARKAYGPELESDIKSGKLNTTKLASEWEGFKGGESRGQGVSDAKRADNSLMSDDRAEELFTAAPKTSASTNNDHGVLTDAMSGASAGIDPDLGVMYSSDPEAQKEINDLNMAAFTGVRRGIQGLVTGAAEAIMPESAFAPIRAKLNEFESQFNEVTEKHPNIEAVGKMVGSTAGIMASSGLLGTATVAAIMPRALTATWSALGWAGRGIVAGTTAGATQYYPEPDAEQRPLDFNPRAFDAATGGFLGGTGAFIGRGVQWAAKNLSETTYGAGFVSLLSQNAKGMARNSEVPLGEAMARYSAVESRGAGLYDFTNAAGRRIEGFPSGVGSDTSGMSQALDEFKEGNKLAAIPVTPKASATARKIEDTLGVRAEKERYAAWETQQGIYEQRLAEAQNAGSAYAPYVAEQLRAKGALPNLPKAPDPFEPRPVRASDYSEARKVVNAAYKGKLSPSERTQLQMLQRKIDDVANDTAGELGMGAEEFVRKARAADRFHETTVAPLRNNVFGGQSSAVAKGRDGVPFSGVTPAAFWDRMVSIIDKDDTVAARDLAAVLGPRGKEQVTQVVMTEALQRMEGKGAEKGTLAAVKYIQDHQNVLREVFGRDEYTDLIGRAKIAETIAPHNAGEIQRVFEWGHSIGPALGMYQLMHAGRAALTGGAVATHLLEASVMFGAVPLAHILTRITQSIHAVPIVRPLVKRAAGLTPGSPEMQSLVQQIERRVRAATTSMTRVVTQPSSGGGTGSSAAVPVNAPQAEWTPPPSMPPQ